MRDFLSEGSHTWDIVVEYHKCPECETVIENRNRYEKRHDKWQLEIDCTRCDCTFTVTKKMRPTFGPLTGR